MSEYRAYLIGSDGHFTCREGFEAADDDAAIEIAKRFARLCDVEVWQAARKVGLITPPGRGERDRGGNDQQRSGANRN